MSRKVYVIGVGMTKFEKPGSKAWDYPDMAKEAGMKALEDAGIPYSEVEQAVVGYVYGESTCGQRAVYQLGLTGIPVYNVNNNCSTGSTALFMGKQLVEGGLSDCVLALGFEKMQKGSLGATFTDRINPMDQHVNAMVQLRGFALASMGVLKSVWRLFSTQEVCRLCGMNVLDMESHEEQLKQPFQCVWLPHFRAE